MNKEITIEYLEKLDKEDKFFPIMKDWYFKRFLRENPKFLCMLINVTLGLNVKVKDIKFDSTELPKENSEEYFKDVDILFHIGKYITVDIECNSRYFESCSERNLAYADKLYGTCYKSGTDYSEIKEFQVYQLNLNPFEKRFKRYINESIYETGEKSSKIYTKNKRIVLKYLEYYYYLYYNLGIRTKEVVILASLISKSFKEFYLMMLNIFSKKDADDILRRMISMNINGFAVGEMWSKERYDYIAAEKEKEIIERELQDSLELGRKDGIAIGKEQGISIGKEQGISIGTIETKENIVNNMLRKNMPYELISEVSDVPVEEVKKLAKRLSSQVS